MFILLTSKRDKMRSIFFTLISIPPPYGGTNLNGKKMQADCLFER